MADRLTVILVEGAYLVQTGIGQLLTEFPGMKITAIYDGTEKHLVQKIKSQRPDILFIDPNTAAIDLIPFLREIEAGNSLQIIGLVNNDTPPNVASRFKHVVNLYDGKFELLEQMKSILGKRLVAGDKTRQNQELSDRERTILREIVLGQTNQEIADKLFLSIHTVTTHRKNLTNKLGIKTVSGLTVYALLNRLVDIHDIEHK